MCTWTLDVHMKTMKVKMMMKEKRSKEHTTQVRKKTQKKWIDKERHGNDQQNTCMSTKCVHIDKI